MKQCAHCGKEFVPSDYRVLTCSPECRLRRQRMLDNERYENLPPERKAARRKQQVDATSRRYAAGRYPKWWA